MGRKAVINQYKRGTGYAIFAGKSELFLLAVSLHGILLFAAVLARAAGSAAAAALWFSHDEIYGMVEGHAAGDDSAESVGKNLYYGEYIAPSADGGGSSFRGDDFQSCFQGFYSLELADECYCSPAFVGNGELYVGYGFCWNYRRDMFRYDIAQNQWDSIDVDVSFHGYPTRSFGGTGCTCAGRHFMGTGYYKQSLDWWAEFMPEGYWVKRASVPGKSRTIAASAASSNYVYISGGMHYGGMNTHGSVLQDIMRYNPNDDNWQYIAIMPKKLMNHNCFTINNTVYFGLGENEELEINDQLYYFEE